MSLFPSSDIEAIAASDDLHVSPLPRGRRHLRHADLDLVGRR